MQSRMRLAGAGLAIFLFGGAAGANTLSDAYYAAYTDPDSFDSGYLRKVAGQGFYTNFYNCSALTIAILNNLVRQTQASHKACTNNSQCQQRARDAQNAGYFRDKLQALDEYIKTTHSKNGPSFLQSRAGTWAKQMQASPVPIAQLPLFRGEMAQLQAVQCP
jgi:hypothetical protein